MKDIDWNHPKIATNPALMAFSWQSAMMVTLFEGNMKKYFPQALSIMKQFQQL